MEFNRLSLVNIKSCSDVLDTAVECSAQVSTFFHKIDTNKDGFITFHQFLSLVGKFSKIYEPLFEFREELYATFLPKRTVIKILNRKCNIDDILSYKATHNNQLPPLSCMEKFKLLLSGESHPDCFDYYDDFKNDKSNSMVMYAGSGTIGNNKSVTTTTPSPVNKCMFNQLSEVDEEKINNANTNNNNNNNTTRTEDDDDVNNKVDDDGEEDNTNNNNNKTSEKKNSSFISTTIPGSESPLKSATVSPTSLDNNKATMKNNNSNNSNTTTTTTITNVTIHNNRNTIITPTSLNTNTVNNNNNNNILPITSSNHNNLTLNLTGFSLSPSSTLRGKSLLSTPMNGNCEISLETLIRQLVRRRNPCKILPSKIAFNVQALSRICKKDDEIEMYYINCFPRNPRYIPITINESASFMSQNGYLDHFGSSKLKLSTPGSNNPLFSGNGGLLSDRDLLRKTSCDSTKNVKLSLTPPHSILRRTRKNSQYRNNALSVETAPYKVSLAKSMVSTPHGKSALKKVVYPDNNEDSADSAQ